MNLTLSISTVLIIALYVALTEQMQGETSSDVGNLPSNPNPETNNPLLKPCKKWIMDDGFSNETKDALKNLEKANELKPQLENLDSCTINIWTRGYALTLIARIDIQKSFLLPEDYCLIFCQNNRIEWEEITPHFPMFTCPGWLYLKGYSQNNPSINVTRAKIQKNTMVTPVTPECVKHFIELLNSEHDKKFEDPVKFCAEKMGIKNENTLVKFKDCKI